MNNNTVDLLDQTTHLIKNYLTQVHDGDRKVVNFYKPEVLKQKFDFAISADGLEKDQIFDTLQEVLDHSVATIHPRFFNQLYAGADIYSIMAEWVTTILNTSMYTYEVGPLFTLMEEYIFSKNAEMIGRDHVHDGLMLPGGSNSNLYAMQMARYALDPEIHQSGLYNKKKLIVLTSDEAHYSITKSAMLMGLGKDAVIKVATDDQGRMLVQDLEAKINEIREGGDEVFMINATSGTTVMGAYDPLDEITQIGKKYNIRVHVDGIRGGAVFFDEDLSKKIKGLDQVDSFAWNPHKMMGANMQCSVWITRRPDVTAHCNVLKTQYLFNDDKGYGVGCDTGDKYTQCGRRVDVLKLRYMRKVYGDQQIASNIRKAFDDAQYLVTKIHQSPQLYLYHEPQCTNVNFRYIPSELELPHPEYGADGNFDYDAQEHQANLEYIKEHYDRIHTVTAQIKTRMLERGEMMTGYTHTKGFPNFFRMITISPKVTHEDLDFVVEHIQELGHEIEKLI